MHGLFLNLLPVSFQFPVSSFGLKHLDEAASRMQVLQWKLLVTGLESVDLEAEGDAFLPTFFPRSELSADAVNLQEERGPLGWVPIKLHGVQL